MRTWATVATAYAIRSSSLCYAIHADAGPTRALDRSY